MANVTLHRGNVYVWDEHLGIDITRSELLSALDEFRGREQIPAGARLHVLFCEVDKAGIDLDGNPRWSHLDAEPHDGGKFRVVCSLIDGLQEGDVI